MAVLRQVDLISTGQFLSSAVDLMKTTIIFVLSIVIYIREPCSQDIKLFCEKVENKFSTQLKMATQKCTF